MFKTIATISVLTALVFSLACQQAAPDVRDGSVELVTSGVGADAAPVRLTIEGLDSAFSVEVEVTCDAGSERISLPAGLYAVNAVPSVASSDAVDAVVLVESAPVLVVVTPGRSSTVNVRQVEASVTTSALACLDSCVR